ncbi:hypothetical protein G9396_14340 [Providencia rettgeri]|nr:hypothetical protein G9396_14340 [Providencia rettgeri]
MTLCFWNCAINLGTDAFSVQATRTGMPVVWVRREQLLEVVDFLKKLPKPYVMLFDLHGVDERQRIHRQVLRLKQTLVFSITLFLLTVTAILC